MSIEDERKIFFDGKEKNWNILLRKISQLELLRYFLPFLSNLFLNLLAFLIQYSGPKKVYVYSIVSKTGCRNTFVCREFSPVFRQIISIFHSNVKSTKMCHLYVEITVFCVENTSQKDFFWKMCRQPKMVENHHSDLRLMKLLFLQTNSIFLN